MKYYGSFGIELKKGMPVGFTETNGLSNQGVIVGFTPKRVQVARFAARDTKTDNLIITSLAAHNLAALEDTDPRLEYLVV